MALPLTRRGVAAGLLVLAVVATCVRLGFWQLDRLEQRRSANQALREALALPPLELTGDSLAAVAADPGAYHFRRARARGVYLPEAEVVLRGRAMDGRPGVHLATPLRLRGTDAAVAVLRGWAPAPDAVSVEPAALAERGPRVVEGVLLPLPRPEEPVRPMEVEVGGARVLTAQRLDPLGMRDRTGLELLPLQLQQLPGPDDPELPARLPLPDVDDPGPHLGYAVQWFSFAAIALIGFLLLAWRSSRGAR